MKMEKSIALFALCFIIAFDCKVEKRTIFFARELTGYINQAVAACRADGDDVAAYLRTIRDGKYDDRQSFQRFLHCLCSSTGFADDDGLIYTEKLLPLFPEQDKMRELFDTCNQEKGKTPQETNYLVFKCLQIKSPYKVAFAKE